jgi:hypothetical protein
MGAYVWKRLLVLSFTLAAAGILACAAAVIDVLLPQASVPAFLGSMVFLGGAVIGTMAAFVWLCDRCEDYFAEYLDRLLDRSGRVPPPGAAKSVGIASPRGSRTATGHVGGAFR